MDTGGSFYEGKLAGAGGYPLPSSTELKKDQSCTSTRMRRLIVDCIVPNILFYSAIYFSSHLKANSDKNYILSYCFYKLLLIGLSPPPQPCTVHYMLQDVYCNLIQSLLW